MFFRLFILINLMILFSEGSDTLISIQDDSLRVQYELSDRGQFGTRLSVSLFKKETILRESKTYIEHTIYKVATGDINEDGTADICIGVLARTPFDTSIKKRVFIYTHREGVISPLWMGSKLGNNLQDFTVIKQNKSVLIKTIENYPENNFSVGEYRWRSFGPSWIRYIKKGIPYEEAFKLFSS